MPRKTKLTPQLQQDMLNALAVGATHRLACQYVGITEECFYNWLRLAQMGKAPYSEFSEAVKKAEGRAAVGWLAKIEAAANEGSWQAAAWKLERRYAQEYGRQILEQQHTGKDGGPIQFVIRGALGEDDHQLPVSPPPALPEGPVHKHGTV